MRAEPFTVAIAGRPNVGKSTLFNRLLGRRRSIVHDLPGMTRDVLEAEVILRDGRSYRLLDTGGYDADAGTRGRGDAGITGTDGETGRWGDGEIPIAAQVAERAARAMKSADLIVLVVDASEGMLPGDLAAAQAARASGVETIVAANKIDRKRGAQGEFEAWELGFVEVYGVSAEHGVGVEELSDAIASRLTEGAGGKDERAAAPISLAVVGRPNVGKSSLVNALLGEERALVSEVPGTTRDSVDALFRAGDRTFRLVDTAGIRRKGRTERGPEVLSVVQARKRIAECDVALLVLDAAEGPAAQDASVASYVEAAGKGLVLVANKWDLASARGGAAAKEIRSEIDERLPFARYAPLLLASAATGRGLARILDTVAEVAGNQRRRIPTGELNRALGRALRDKPPRSASGKRLNVLYVAQTATAPPTFTLVANRAEALHFSESRRIENLLRKAADFSGSPIRISVRARSAGDRVETRARRRSS